MNDYYNVLVLNYTGGPEPFLPSSRILRNVPDLLAIVPTPDGEGWQYSLGYATEEAADGFCAEMDQVGRFQCLKNW